MDIHPLPGNLQHETSGGVSHWRLSLPIVFSGISTGPEGIYQFALRSAAQEIRLEGPQTAHGSKGSGAAGPEIAARPIPFRNEKDDTNTIVFSATCQFSNGAPPTSFHLNLDLSLTNLATLTVPLSLTCDGGQMVQVGLGTRERAPRLLALGHFFLLICMVGVLSIWTHSLTEVHESAPPVWRNPALLSMALGAILTFLGLSIRRVRALFVLLRNTAAFFRWPELHLDPSLFRALAHRWAWIPLSVALVLVTGIAWSWRAVNLEVPEKTVLWNVADGRPGEIIVSGKVFNRFLLLNSEHLELICEQSAQENLKQPFRLASVSPNGRYRHLTVTLALPLASHSYGPTSAINFLRGGCPAGVPPQICADVAILLCTEQSSEHVSIGEFVTRPKVDSKVTNVDGQKQETLDLHLQEAPQWNSEDLDRWMEQIKNGVDEQSSFKGQDCESETNGRPAFFAEREELLSKAEQFLRAEISGGKVDPQGLTDISVQLLKDTHNLGSLDCKKSVERSILIRALWRVAGTGLSEDLLDSQIDQLVAQFSTTLQRKFPQHSGFIAMTEAALEVQAHHSGRFRDKLHNAIVEAIHKFDTSSDRGLENDLYFTYARAFLRSRACHVGSAPQRRYFQGEANRLRQRHGPQDLVDLLIVNLKDGEVLQMAARDAKPRYGPQLRSSATGLWEGEPECLEVATTAVLTQST